VNDLILIALCLGALILGFALLPAILGGAK
jgi:hypothetical protein